MNGCVQKLHFCIFFFWYKKLQVQLASTEVRCLIKYDVFLNKNKTKPKWHTIVGIADGEVASPISLG